MIDWGFTPWTTNVFSVYRNSEQGYLIQNQERYWILDDSSLPQQGTEEYWEQNELKQEECSDIFSNLNPDETHCLCFEGCLNDFITLSGYSKSLYSAEEIEDIVNLLASRIKVEVENKKVVALNYNPYDLEERRQIGEPMLLFDVYDNIDFEE
jgi:hypothetical protein